MMPKGKIDGYRKEWVLWISKRINQKLIENNY